MPVAYIAQNYVREGPQIFPVIWRCGSQLINTWFLWHLMPGKAQDGINFDGCYFYPQGCCKYGHHKIGCGFRCMNHMKVCGSQLSRVKEQNASQHLPLMDRVKVHKSKKKKKIWNHSLKDSSSHKSNMQPQLFLQSLGQNSENMNDPSIRTNNS